jgi:hypothetical protein
MELDQEGGWGVSLVPDRQPASTFPASLIDADNTSPISSRAMLVTATLTFLHLERLKRILRP